MACDVAGRDAQACLWENHAVHHVMISSYHRDAHVGVMLWAGAVSTPMYLRRAAEVLAKESCGEPWLLQPKIRDMESLEYR